MLDIFRGLKHFVKLSHLHIDSPVFRLHYSITVLILIAFSLIVTTRQYVGNPIDCVHTKDIPEDVLNTYCWIHSTYTVKSAFLKKVGVEVAYPGVETSRNDKDKKVYRYYQWVCFCLFFQNSILKKPNFNPVKILGLNWVYKLQHDPIIFRVSTLITTGIILCAIAVLLISKLWGDSIKCSGLQIKSDFLEPFCWIHSTYSVKEAFKMKVGVEVIYPGLGRSKDGSKTERYHNYYQWVPLALACQAILFYTPRWLWKSWEGGKIHALMMDLDIGICSEIEKKQKKKLMLDYLWENLRYHNWWAYKYYFCEVLALANVIGQMFLMNRFFDGAFLTFGLEVINFLDSDQEDRVDPMILIFPRMTKCTFYKYGVSGEIERHDAICILPLNVVNEKIYVFLWFWFIILGFLTAISVFYRIIIIFSPRMRVYLLRMRYRLIRADAIDLIVRRSKMGDWFLFYMLGENVDSVIFRDVMQELANKLAKSNFHHLGGFKGEIQDA